MAKFIGRG